MTRALLHFYLLCAVAAPLHHAHHHLDHHIQLAVDAAHALIGRLHPQPRLLVAAQVWVHSGYEGIQGQARTENKRGSPVGEWRGQPAGVARQ